MTPLSSSQQAGLKLFDRYIDDIQRRPATSPDDSKRICKEVENKIVDLIQSHDLASVPQLSRELSRLKTVVDQQLKTPPDIVDRLIGKITKSKNSTEKLQDAIDLIQEVNDRLTSGYDIEKSSFSITLKNMATRLTQKPTLSGRVSPGEPKKRQLGQEKWSDEANQSLEEAQKALHILETTPLNNGAERIKALFQLDTWLNRTLEYQQGNLPITDMLKQLSQIELQLAKQVYGRDREGAIYSEAVFKEQENKLQALHDRVSMVRRVINLSQAIPTEISALSEESSAPAIEAFIEVASQYIKTDAAAAYRLLRQLANRMNSPVLKTLVRDGAVINFGYAPIHRNVIEAVVGLHDALTDVRYGSISSLEGTLNLSRAPPAVALNILREEESQLHSLTLADSFLESKKLQELSTDIASLNTIKRLDVVSKDNSKPLHLTKNNFKTMCQLFSEVRVVSLPPIKLSDLAVLKQNEWQFDKEKKLLIQSMREPQPAMQLALLSSLASGGMEYEEFCRIFKSFEINSAMSEANRYMQVIFQQIRSGGSNLHLPTMGDNMVNGWVTAAHYLLSTDLFTRVTLEADEGTAPFVLRLSEQPLLTDDLLQQFLLNKDENGGSNLSKAHWLHLSYNPNLTASSLSRILQEPHPLLDELCIAGNQYITDEWLINLPQEALESLKFIELTGTPVTERGIAALKERYPELYIKWDPRCTLGAKLQHEEGDVQLRFPNGAVRVHHDLIVRRSPEALKMAREKGVQDFEIDFDLSEKAQKVLVHWLYTGDLIQLDAESAAQLAQLKTFPRLQWFSLVYYIQSTTPENVLVRWDTCPKIAKRFLMEYMMVNCQPGLPGWERLSETNQKRVEEILTSLDKKELPRMRGWLYERNIFPREPLAEALHPLTIKNSRGKDETTLDTSVPLLRLTSSKLFESLHGVSDTLISEYPLATQRALAHAMRPFDPPWMKEDIDPKMFSQVCEYLDEVTRLGLISVVKFTNFDWWIDEMRRREPNDVDSPEGQHVDWSRLNNWIVLNMNGTERKNLLLHIPTLPSE